MLAWPEGKKCGVLLTFDLDGETLWTSRNAQSWNSPLVLAQGSYGPKVGVFRILDLLDKHRVKATFFIPGWIIEKYPDTAKEVHNRGHEIAYHGYLHEFDPDLDYEKEKALMDKCESIIENITGKKPIGHRTPNGEMKPHTLQLIRDKGYTYSANMMDNDKPYFHKVDGKEIPLVEFPSDWLYDDSSHYFFTLQNPPRRGIAPTSHVLEIWKDEFDGLYEEGGLLNLIMHPQISGRASRVNALDKLPSSKS
jgi:peptidoglycan/xylan/chitin deacetylase (PgdA/CDA1 family)